MSFLYLGFSFFWLKNAPISLLMILGKITTLCSSMMGRPDLRPQHMEVRMRKLVLSLAGRTNQESSSLANPRPESTRR